MTENKNLEMMDCELTEDELEAVDGGIVGWIILGCACGVVGGVSAYKLRKALQSASGTCK